LSIIGGLDWNVELEMKLISKKAKPGKVSREEEKIMNG
jgi:hypothetical protein